MDNNETKHAWNKPYDERERGKLFDADRDEDHHPYPEE